MTDKIEVTQADKNCARNIRNAWDVSCDTAFEIAAQHRILATRTDATPVAVEMVAELQLSAFLAGRGSIRTKANGNTHESSPGPTMDDYRRMARTALAEGQVDATPVALAHISLEDDGPYIDLQVLNGETLQPADKPVPLYTHPPATDVAALVEAAKETNAALERDGDPAFAHLILANKAALAPFTKGQNDE